MLVEQARPDAKCARVHVDHVIGLADAIDPGFDFIGLLGILLTGDLDSRLQFAERHGREVEILVGGSLQPGQDSPVRFWAPQLRNHVRVEEIHAANP